MPSNAVKPYEEKMSKAIERLHKELNTIRAGRANPSLLDNVKVDYYGTPTPVNQMAAIAVTEARVLTVTPWDPSALQELERSLLASDIGINPTNDGKNIRLVFPSPTEDRRKELCRDVSGMGEETKVNVRNVRREGIEHFKSQEKDGDISEDLLKRLEDEMQKITDNNTKAIDDVCKKKSEEIMEI